MVLLPLLLTACAPNLRVLPESGWYGVDAGQTDWSCGAKGPANGLRADGLVWVEVGESWRWADDTDPLPCVFDGLSFSCEVFDTGFAYAQTDHTDATVAWSARIEASWIEAETIEGEIWADYTCSGADCARIAPEYGDGFAFPCAAVTPWTASFVGEG